MSLRSAALTFTVLLRIAVRRSPVVVNKAIDLSDGNMHATKSQRKMLFNGILIQCARIMCLNSIHPANQDDGDGHWDHL